MKRVLVFCEGPTEETFIRDILAPAFYSKDISIAATPCNGVSKYSIIKKRVECLCKSDPTAIITTMLDFYGLPSETPGKNLACGQDIYFNVKLVEDAIGQDIGMSNFIPNLMMHEFEALLFSEPECFQFSDISQNNLNELKDIAAHAETPEHINNSPETAPSKRILRIYPQYNKVIDGYNIAKEIGLDTMRAKCKHFDEWLNGLEAEACK